MLNIVSSFSDKNDGKFNDDLLIRMRKEDDMVMYIDEACSAIMRLLPQYVKYKGYYYNDNRKRALKRDQGKDDGKKPTSKKEVRIHINDTYAKEAVFEFDCTFGGQTVTQTFTLWIPMLIDNCHFYIRGNKYSTPLQVIDAITFNKKNVLVLKTIARAIKFERSKHILTDIYGNKYVTNKLGIYVKNKAIPFLLYYFEYFGFFKTLEYFGADKYIQIYSGTITSGDGVPPNKVIFKFGTVFLAADAELFATSATFRMFVATIISAGKRTMTMDYIRNPVRWTMLAGETISIPKSLEKGEALLNTFIVSLDHRTKTIINQLVPGELKENMFAVVRWIFYDYSRLCTKDDGLQNKRVRLNEYLISPFIKTFTEKVYRFINTADKLKTLDGLLDVFKIKSSLILNAIIGKIDPKVTGLNIAKYSAESNDDGLVNSLLNVTKSGPGSPYEKSNRLGMSYRLFSIDSVGLLDIIGGTSSNDPGKSRYMCPMAKFDLERKIFEVDKMLIKK